MNLQLLEFIGKKLRPVELRILVKYLLNIKRKTIHLPDNSVYFIDPVSDFGLQLLMNNTYEPEMSKAIMELLEEGDTFVDLGSNEGYFAIMAGIICGKEGKVFAIEPQQRLWEVIRQNIRLNELGNVEVIPYGIGSRNEELLLYLYPTTNSGASSFSEKYNFKIAGQWLRRKLYGTQSVKVFRLDDFINSFPPDIKLIKIDIEGFELEALKGAAKLLANKVFKNILVEIHPEALSGMNQREGDIDSLLLSFGYRKKGLSTHLNLFTIG